MHTHSATCGCVKVIDASRSDPTGTKSIRNGFERALIARFSRLKALINQALLQNDVLGLTKPIYGDSANVIRVSDDVPSPKAFQFLRSGEKVSQFMAWLVSQEDEGIFEVQAGAAQVASGEAAWMNSYIDSAYNKGVRDAAKTMEKGGASISGQWIQAAFNRPIHADRLGLAYTRSFTELKGITDVMDQQISRTLAAGLGEGKGVRQIARELNERVDAIGIKRARMLARTEVIAAHAEATLNAFEEAGLEGVNVEAEVINGSDPCPECEDLAANGPYTIEKARGMLPAHPNCVCTWVAEVVGGSGITLV